MNRFVSGKKIIAVLFPILLLLFFCAAAWASGGGGESGEPAVGWQTIDTYKVLNFALLVIVLFFLAKNPVKNFFTSRIKGIEDELTTLEQKKDDAERKAAEYEEKLATLNEQTEKIIEDYVNQGEEAKKRILAEAQSQAAKLEEMAKRNIEQEFKAARDELKTEVVEKAVLEAEKMIRDSISSADQDKLVDEYLEKVVA